MGLQEERRRLNLKISKILLFIAFLVSHSFSVRAEIYDSKYIEANHMVRGDLQTIKNYELSHFSVSNPDVADIVNIDSDHILLIARAPGETELFIWDKYDKRAVIIRVQPEELGLLKDRIQILLNEVDVKDVALEISNREGKIIASGSIPQKRKEQFEKMIAPFADRVINLVKR